MSNHAPTVIRASYLIRAAGFTAGKDEARQVLRGIRIENSGKGSKGAILVATNGMRLGCFHDDIAMIGKPENWHIPTTLHKDLRKRPRETYERWAILQRLSDKVDTTNLCPATLSIVQAPGPKEAIDASVLARHNIYVDAPDVEYPQWRRAISSFKPSGSMTVFNSDHMPAFVRAVCTGSRRPRMAIHVGEAEGMSMIRSVDDLDFVGVVMHSTSRNDAIPDSKFPSWMGV